MNYLSWVIYLADVASRVPDVLAAVIFCLLGFAIVLVLWGWFERSEAYDWNDKLVAPNRLEEGKRLHKKLYWVVPLAIVLGLFSSLIPRKETLYLIAASEITDRAVLQDPELQEIIKLSKKRVLSYLKEEDEVKKPEEVKKEETE